MDARLGAGILDRPSRDHDLRDGLGGRGVELLRGPALVDECSGLSPGRGGTRLFERALDRSFGRHGLGPEALMRELAMTPWMKARVGARLLLLQARWDPVRMQGPGFAFALDPWLAICWAAEPRACSRRDDVTSNISTRIRSRHGLRLASSVGRKPRRLRCRAPRARRLSAGSGRLKRDWARRLPAYTIRFFGGPCVPRARWRAYSPRKWPTTAILRIRRPGRR